MPFVGDDAMQELFGGSFESLDPAPSESPDQMLNKVLCDLSQHLPKRYTLRVRTNRQATCSMSRVSVAIAIVPFAMFMVFYSIGIAMNAQVWLSSAVNAWISMMVAFFGWLVFGIFPADLPLPWKQHIDVTWLGGSFWIRDGSGNVINVDPLSTWLLDREDIALASLVPELERGIRLNTQQSTQRQSTRDASMESLRSLRTRVFARQQAETEVNALLAEAHNKASRQGREQTRAKFTQ